MICQLLVPKAHGKGRALASEIMIANPAIRALIRDNKAHQITSIIQTSGKIGMQTMNQSVYELYRGGHVTYEEALLHAPDSGEFERLIERTSKTAGAR